MTQALTGSAWSTIEWSDEPWMDQAACHGRTEIMFAGDSTDPAARSRSKQAQTVCADCPVRTDCLDYADQHPTEARYGTWGGLTAGQLRRRRRRLKADAS